MNTFSRYDRVCCFFRHFRTLVQFQIVISLLQDGSGWSDLMCFYVLRCVDFIYIFGFKNTEFFQQYADIDLLDNPYVTFKVSEYENKPGLGKNLKRN